MLTDWLADKMGEERGGGGDREMERTACCLARKLGNPPHLAFTSLPPSHLPVCE